MVSSYSTVFWVALLHPTAKYYVAAKMNLFKLEVRCVELQKKVMDIANVTHFYAGAVKVLR